jgi:hypothetical protein
MRVRSALARLAALAILGIAAPAGAAMMFTADMDEGQEVAPAGASDTPGTAQADLQLVDLGGGNFSLQMQILFTSHFNFMNLGGVDNGGGQVASALHIHNAARGTNGGVAWGIFGPDNDTDNDTVLTSNPDGTTLITTEWDLGEGLSSSTTLVAFLSALQGATTGQDVALYLNLHTNLDPSGAIRGQLVAAPEPTALLLLTLGLAGLAYRRLPS